MLYKIKRYASGKLTDKFKVRLIAKGYSQKYSVDYEKTFALVVGHSTGRILSALAVKHNINVDQLDEETAFQSSSNLHELARRLCNERSWK